MIQNIEQENINIEQNSNREYCNRQIIINRVKGRYRLYTINQRQDRIPISNNSNFFKKINKDIKINKDNK